jgi:hypothetical protein
MEMGRGHALTQRILDWWHETNWASSVGGFEPDEERRDDAELAAFEQRQQRRLARMNRLEAIADVRFGSEQEDP